MIVIIRRTENKRQFEKEKLADVSRKQVVKTCPRKYWYPHKKVAA